MKHSTTIGEIAGAMLKFQTEVGKISKSAVNPFFKSTYAPLHEILSAIRKPLTDAGLVVMQFPTGENYLETIIIHRSGEWVRDKYYMKPIKADPQSFGSVITYQKRYALVAILGLNVEEDDDGNRASGPMEPSQKQEIFRLLNTAVNGIDDASILEAMDTFSCSKAEDCINYLKENQADPVADGSSYNQGDIQKKLDIVDADEKK